MQTSGVYEIVNNANGKRYIGSAVRLSDRWGLHVRQFIKCIHHNIHLQRVWNKHGADVFKFRPLLVCAKKDLLFYEQRCIDGLRPEYNICLTAGSALGVTRSPEMRAKVSKARAGKPASPETRAKMSAAHMGNKYASNPSQATSDKLRAIAKARVMSAETRAKLSVARIGNKNALGSKGCLGCKRSPETIAKLTGRTFSLVTREKLSKTQSAHQALKRSMKGEKQCRLF